MKRVQAFGAAFLFLGVLASADPAAAADKTHQQMMAEIRMLQEQQQQLQQLIGTLADSLKALGAKIDDHTGVVRKAFADSKLQIDGISDGVRILREKADDTNVRLSTMTQELESLRQGLSAAAAAAAAPPIAVPPATPVDPSATTPPVTPAPAVPAPGNVSPGKAWDSAWNDYTAGQYDLAIAGFEYFIKTFPTSPRAGEAQLNIGNSHYFQGNYKEAVAAYQKVIADYPQSPAVPQAWFKLGQSYEAMKQPELARRAYETVIKNHAGSPDATLAKQRLDSLDRKE